MSRALSIALTLLLLNGCLPALAQIRVDFAPDKQGGCSPLILHFSNYTSGASSSATYLWDFGNGNTAAVRDAQAVFVEEGDYTVTLTVHDGSASGIATHTITVYAKPKPTFSFSPGTVCGPQPITFTAGGDAGGAGSIVHWLWDFGDGSTMQSFGPTALHVYAQSITTPASLTVTNSFGCVDTITRPVSITVLTPATSAFTSDKRVLCLVTDPVQFTSNSTGPAPLTYSWDFGDATGSTQKDPGHSYSAKGNYNVILTTTAANGCTATSVQNNYLNVANYATDFDVPATAVCQNSTVYFTDKSTPAPDNRQWLVDGNPYSYYSPLQYYFSTPGTHTIQLNNLYGNCPQSATHTVTVNAVPTGVSYDMNQTPACDHVTVAFTDKTPDAVSWNWNFNYYSNGLDQSAGGTVSHDFSYGVPYAVRMTVTNAAGCSTSVVGQVYVNKPTISIYEPSYSPSASCNQPLTKTYAINNLSELSSWTWDFGDGTSATDASPTHVFSSPGIYSIVLRYIDKNGCSGTTNSLSVTISSPMTLDFTANTTTACAGTAVHFSSPSLAAAAAAPGAGGMGIYWDFGDGYGSGNLDPDHSYSSPGTYTVTLTARNSGGCFTPVTKQSYITVLEAPGAFVSHAYTCNGDRNEVTFMYTPGTATSVVWSFGDGSSQTTDANTTTVTHTYASTGTYNLEVMASNGTCSHGNSDRVYVLKKQNLRLSANTNVVCASGTLNVDLAAERNPAQTYSGYFYDYTPQFSYADGTPFTGSVVLTTPYDPYTNGAFHFTLSGFTPGQSGLQLTTTSFYFNCTDQSNTLPLTIQGAATAAFTIVNDKRCFQSPVVLQDASTPGANNSIVSETWDFGDGNSVDQIGGTVSHVYANPGQYAVRLTIGDAAGCTTYSGANQNYVSVNGPKASFSPSPGTDVNLNTNMYFVNTTNTYGSNNTMWSWDFGDGSTSTDYYPYHTYTIPGKYTVTLTASNPSQPNTCITTASTTINVRNFNSHFSTTASYVGTASCPPLLAQFYNTSSNYVSVRWDFGDGWTAGNVNAPGHVYQRPGRYIVTLFVEGYNGLTASYVDSVFVRAPAAGLFATTPLVCQGQPAVYEAKATASKSYVFDFGDGSVGASSYPDSVMQHNYTMSGNYVARLVVTDTFGCQAAASAAVKLLVHPLPTVAISPLSPYVCKDGSVTLTASGGHDYLWSPALGLSRTDAAITVATPVDVTKYEVLVTDDAGCQSTGSVTVDVTFKQKITVSPDSTSVCEGQSVRLIAKGADYYSWLGDVGGLSVPGSVTARPPVSSVYTVIGQDIHFCFSDTANVIVTVLPVPSVNGGPDVEVLAGSPVVLSASGSSDVIRWEWTPSSYLSCTDCAQPTASPKKPEDYIVKVFNSVGCSVADTVEARILCEASRVRIPDAFSPNGDGHNDRWVILGIGLVKHVVVYNRWGLKMFERNSFYPADAVDCWDGYFNGSPAPVGAYAYYIEMECPTGGVFGRRGTVVLVR